MAPCSGVCQPPQLVAEASVPEPADAADKVACTTEAPRQPRAAGNRRRQGQASPTGAGRLTRFLHIFQRSTATTRQNCPTGFIQASTRSIAPLHSQMGSLLRVLPDPPSIACCTCLVGRLGASRASSGRRQGVPCSFTPAADGFQPARTPRPGCVCVCWGRGVGVAGASDVTVSSTPRPAGAH